MNGKQSSGYIELIQAIELLSIRTMSLSYKTYDKSNLSEQHGSVNVRKGSIELDEKNKILNCNVGFDIAIEAEKNQAFFKMNLQYMLEFRVKEVEVVKSVLSNEETLEFFSNRQLVRLAWSYVRNELSHALASSGHVFVPLPLLK